MAGETLITVIGNLTADPELRFTPAGVAVANFTIASTPRTFDRTSNDWKDGDTLFLRASVWREYAENVAETLTKGARVIAQGNLKARPYTTKEGESRTSWELDVLEVGPSLRYAQAKVQRITRQDAPASGWKPATPDPVPAGTPSPLGGAPSDDPWGVPLQQDSEPPF